MDHVSIILPNDGVIWNRFAGLIVPSDLSTMNAKMRGHPEFDPKFVIINDMRDVTGDTVSFLDMLHVTEEIGRFRGQNQVPLYVGFIAPNDTRFGMARMFQSLVEQSDANVGSIIVARDCETVFGQLNVPVAARATIKAGALPRTDNSVDDPAPESC